MSSSRYKTQFMDSTEASRAHRANLESALKPRSSLKDTIIASASRHLNSLSRKENSGAYRTPARLQVSSPYGFQKLGEPSLSATVPSGRAQATPEPAKHQMQNVLRPTIEGHLSRCTSPLDKPLPSIPVASIDSKSPKPRRSLIDAAEKPLRRSLSPYTSEDWPALSPEKLKPGMHIDTQVKAHTVSLGESVIDRIKKLNLNDSAGTTRSMSLVSNKMITDTSPESMQPLSFDEPDKNDHDQEQTPEMHYNEENPSLRSSTRSNTTLERIDHPQEEQSPQITAAIGSAVLRAANTATRDIRKRLSSTPLASTDHKKLRLEPTALPDSVTIERSRSNERPEHGQQHARLRSRSRSRHCVTAQGSPFVIPQQSERQISFAEPGQNLTSQFTHGNSGFDTACSQPLPIVAGLAIRRSQVARGCRTSSIPLPRRLLRKSIPAESETDRSDISTDVQEEHVGHDFCNKDADTAIDHKHTWELSATLNAADLENTFVMANPGQRTSGNTTMTIVHDYMQVGGNHSTDSLSDRSVTGTIHAQDEFETFRIRPLNRKMPELGPKLRISDSAATFLGEHNNQDKAITQEELSARRRSTATNGAAKANSSDHGKSSGKYYHARASTTAEPADINLASCDHEVIVQDKSSTEQTINNPLQPSSTPIGSVSAPPIRTGVPQDTSQRVGWPFRESVVTPFQQVESVSSKASGNSCVAPSHSTKMVNDCALEAHGSPEPDQKEAVNTSDRNNDCALVEVPALTTNSFETVLQHLDAVKLLPRSSSLTDCQSAGNLRRNAGPNIENTCQEGEYHNQTKTPVGRLTSYARPGINKTSTRNIRSTQVDPESDNRTLLLSKERPGAVSAGKTVISNLRGLFHKHVHDQQVGQHKLPKTPQFSQHTTKSPLVQALPSFNTPHTLHQSKAKHTPTIFERRLARHESSPFARRHRDIATVKPQNSLLSGHTVPRKSVVNSSTQTSLSPETEPIKQKPENRVPELTAIKDLVHNLLNQANDSPQKRRKEELIEFSKSLIQILHAARTAEQAMEEAKHAALMAEMQCLKVRRDVERVTDLVAKATGH